MNFHGIGDLAQNLMLRRQGGGLKTQMTRLTQELTTGQKQDISRHVSGNFGFLAGLEHQLSKMDAFQQVRDGLNGQLSGVQSSLAAIQSSVDGFGAGLVAAASLEQADVLSTKASNADDHLKQVISYLNTQQNGKFLFSGLATDQSPIASAEFLMNELRSIASVATDSADLIDRMESWFFDNGGGFDNLVYSGSNDTVSGLRISDASQISQPVSAENIAFRKLMFGLAVTSLVSEGTPSVDAGEVQELISGAGQSVIEAQQAITSLQRDVGSSEAKLAREDTAARAERTVMEEAKNRITAVDPFEAAAELEAVQFQIETLYVLTARMSQLRLTDYLR